MEGLKDYLLKLFRLDGLIENLSGYLEAKVQLVKLEIREEVAKIVASSLVVAVVALLALLFVVFISFGLAGWLNKEFNNEYTGYLIVSAVYGVPALLLLLFRRQISTSFERYLLEQAKRKNKHGATGDAGS